MCKDMRTKSSLQSTKHPHAYMKACHLKSSLSIFPSAGLSSPERLAIVFPMNLKIEGKEKMHIKLYNKSRDHSEEKSSLKLLQSHPPC
jgi:hypothetical protein